MKRTYRISVTIEATFDRAVNSRRHAKALRELTQRAIDASSMPAEWVVTGATVRSKAISEAKPRVVPPNPTQVARDTLVASLQVHADGMARLLGGVVKPKLRRYPSRVCWGDNRAQWAHAHTSSKTIYRVSRGKRPVRLGNLHGTICLRDSFLDRILAAPAKVEEMARVTGIKVQPADGLDTIAHEVAHLRLPSRNHNSRAFGELAERLEREYREVLAGTRPPPPPRAFGARSPPRIDARPEAEPQQNEPSFGWVEVGPVSLPGPALVAETPGEPAAMDRPTPSSLSALPPETPVREPARSVSSTTSESGGCPGSDGAGTTLSPEGV